MLLPQLSPFNFISAVWLVAGIRRSVTKSNNLYFSVSSNVCGVRDSSKARNMSWKEVKEKYLSMPVEEKRKHYSVKGYLTLNDIPTWSDYVKEKKGDLAPAKSRHPSFDINEQKNSEVLNKVSLFAGDITALEIDAIVNAANNRLLGGGGVDGAIHAAAGSNLLDECRTLNGCETGEAKITGGYKLPAKYVIHAVGPRGEQPKPLSGCYKNCLSILEQKKLRTIAFPCISTGIYGYPVEPATHIAAYEVRKFLEDHSKEVDRIIFCTFLEKDKQVYESLLQAYFPLPK